MKKTYENIDDDLEILLESFTSKISQKVYQLCKLLKILNTENSSCRNNPRLNSPSKRGIQDKITLK